MVNDQRPGAQRFLAWPATSREQPGTQPAALALAIGLVLFGLLAFLFYSRQSGAVDRNLTMMILVGAGIVLVGLKPFLIDR